MKKTKITLLLIAILISFFGCKKGDVGPQGAAGQNGTNGNADVRTFVVTLDSVAWQQSGTTYYVNLGVSLQIISYAIADSGAVQVFMQNPTQPWLWENLPYIETHPTYFSEYNYSYQPSTVVLTKFNSDSSQTTKPSTQTFKIVAIAK